MHFDPPFKIDVDFYTANGKRLEWHECWGDCPEAAKVVYRVVDAMYRPLSTHNSREAAEAALARQTLTRGSPVK